MTRLFSAITALIFVVLRLHQPTVPSTAVNALDPLSGVTAAFQDASHDLIVAALITLLIFAGFHVLKSLLENWIGR